VKWSSQQCEVGRAAGDLDHRLGDFAAGGVARVEDAALRVAALLAEREVVVVLVEVDAVAGQVVDGRGSLRDDGADDVLAAEAGAGVEGVGHVELDRVAFLAKTRRQHRGDAALGPGGVGIERLALGQNDDRTMSGGPDGEGETGDARADHQEVTGHGARRMAGEIATGSGKTRTNPKGGGGWRTIFRGGPAQRSTSGLPQAQVPGLSELVTHFAQSGPQAQT